MLVIFRLQAFPTERALEEESLNLRHENSTTPFLAGIVFMDVDETSTKMPSLVKYKIRMDIEEGPIMSQIVPPFPMEGVAKPTKFLKSGFLYVQVQQKTSQNHHFKYVCTIEIPLSRRLEIFSTSHPFSLTRRYLEP